LRASQNAGLEIVDWFYDPAVSGADLLKCAPAFPPYLIASKATVCGRSLSRRRAASLEGGKCEGRKSHAERNPELVALAKRLHRHKPKGGRMSLRAISAELAIQSM
jgi:hypothetical protein